jgi:putative (di)nucleoside polyphosphate hydrolase
MNKNFSELPLRTGVGIILLNNENKVFVARRIDNAKKFWQMPQGGVDEGEDFLQAAYRELEEETSVKSVELIKELDGTITYELPDRLLGIIWKGKYKGQKQKWFLMKFTGDEKEIDIKTKNPEFLDWKWIDLDQITEVVVDFKLHVYKELQEKVRKSLFDCSYHIERCLWQMIIITVSNTLKAFNGIFQTNQYARSTCKYFCNMERLR